MVISEVVNKRLILRTGDRLDFGTTKTVPTDTLEGSQEEFVAQRTLHFAYYQRSQTQQYQLLGTKLEGTTVIAVRSKYHVDKTQLARIHGDSTLYRIVTISRDESNSPIRFDLITLQDITKVGANNG